MNRTRWIIVCCSILTVIVLVVLLSRKKTPTASDELLREFKKIDQDLQKTDDSFKAVYDSLILSESQRKGH